MQLWYYKIKAKGGYSEWQKLISNFTIQREVKIHIPQLFPWWQRQSLNPKIKSSSSSANKDSIASKKSRSSFSLPSFLLWTCPSSQVLNNLLSSPLLKKRYYNVLFFFYEYYNVLLLNEIYVVFNGIKNH